MIPGRLEDWSLPAIAHLLQQGCHESETFDFKERLPASKDEAGKERLRRTCAAFANGEGGFLVLGVVDGQTAPPEGRMVGIEKSIDLPAEFGNFPRACQPSVSWSFANPPLLLPNGKVVHVLAIPRSWKGPHWVANAEGRGEFPKRTNKGNENMSYSEIRGAFLGYYEKRLKLQLLLAELEGIDSDASQIQIPALHRGAAFSYNTFSLAIVESVTSDVYTILASEPTLVRDLGMLRRLCRKANSAQSIVHGLVEMPLTNRLERIASYNDGLAQLSAEIRDAVRRAKQDVQRLLTA